MRRAVALVVLVLALAGCGANDRRVREVRLDDGTHCAYPVNRFNRPAGGITCDWGNR